MFGYFILLFTILPALELALLIKVGSNIGVLNTVWIIFMTGILGAFLARLQGFLVLRKIQDNLNLGIMPSGELLDGAMILAGGILLLAPGFITDALGFLLLIPWTRRLIKKWSARKLEKMIAKGQIASSAPFRRPNGYYNDIDI